MARCGPIIYIRGYAATQMEVEATVDDPTHGFNAGSTHIRLGVDGRADFYMFVSPFARLFRDHGYQDVIDGSMQQLPDDVDPDRTIWIYRYYDPTSKTFDRPGGRRLTIEEAALGLRDFIEGIREQIYQARNSSNGTGEHSKVHLVAHSMGGLVARCLLQKVYAAGEGTRKIDKLFTYGTPHGGIHFDVVGGGAIERLRDFVGFNDSDNFGPDRMYKFLTRVPGGKAPEGWNARVVDSASFDTDRIFCVIGTNAEDYQVAGGLSRSVVGPQSDGLVQIENAYVHGAHRAYVHRSHSGRYGLVNSEEGYQNLQRFLFGDFKITASLVNFHLQFRPDTTSEAQVAKGVRSTEITFFVETHVAIRGLPVLMHERTVRHFSAEAINHELYKNRYSGSTNRLSLFTNFLFQGRRDDGTIRYMIRIALFEQRYSSGMLLFGEHIERLPVWSDYLVIEVRALDSESRIVTRKMRGAADPTTIHYEAKYCWASLSGEPVLAFESSNGETSRGVHVNSWKAPLLAGKATEALGPDAAVLIEVDRWS